MVDEHLELKNMVEERALAGKKALGAWFHRCRTELGDIGVGVFRKLMASLVELTMLYGSEIWGCNRDLEKIEQVQMRALRLFFGVGTLHPKVSLLADFPSNSTQFKFHIGSSHIEYTKDYNYLGLSLNEHLTWSKSIALISKKASKANLLTAKSRAYGNFHDNVLSPSLHGHGNVYPLPVTCKPTMGWAIPD